MTRINRRRFTQLSGAGALAAGTGGLAGILASGRAPAYGQTAAVHWLRWADFVPASDVLLKGPIVQQCQKDLGIKLTVETINANDIQARITSSIQSGTGPDIIMGLNNWPQLYARSLADVTELAEQLGKEGGGYYDICKMVGTYDNHWIGVPWCTGGGLVAYRKSWLAEVGAEKFPANWDDYRAVGKKLKAAGRPYGQTAGHTFGDAPGWWYPYLWSWGGKEVEADGKTVVLNTKETIEVGQVRRRPCGRRRWTKAVSPGTTPTTTAPSCRAASAPPTTAPRSISKPRRSPTAIRPRRARR